MVRMKLEVRDKEVNLLKSEITNLSRQVRRHTCLLKWALQSICLSTQLESSKDESHELERTLNLKEHSCEQLSTELQITKREAEEWQYQYSYNDQLVSASL